MKNRPVSSHSNRSKNSPGRFASVKTLVTSGFGLIGIGSLLLLTFFVSQNSITQEQDVQSNASIPQGQVTISQSHTPTVPVLNQVNTFQLQLNTKTTKISEVTLNFDVITEAANDVTIVEANKNLFVYDIEKLDVDHGSKVSVTAKPKNGDGISTNNAAVDLIKIEYRPTKPGPVALAYDRERSKALVFNTKEDQLSHLPVFLTTVPGTTSPSVTPYAEDFTFLNDNLDNYFKFYETTGSRNEVNPRQLVKDRTYTVRHTSRVQNINKDEQFAIDPIIVNQLKVNDSENVTRTFRRSNFINRIAPLELVFETTFKAKEVNTVQVTADSTNVFPEVSENNNTVSVSYTSSSTLKACNELCSSNAECGDNHTCYNTGSEKRCRLSTNLTSTSCSSNPEKRNLSCNQDCGDNNECANGMTCFQNRCRNPYNTENTSCVNPDARAQQLIRESCNTACTDNRGCANNMRCFNGSCRLATNPSSTSCSAATESTIPKGGTQPTPTAVSQPIATALPTATPRTTATPRPTTTATTSAVITPSPEPTPEPSIEPTFVPTPMPTAMPTEPEPNESVLDTFFRQITDLMNSGALWSSSMLTGALLPIAVIIAGVVLLIIALVIVLKPNRGARIMQTEPLNAPSSPTPVVPELHTKPNPPPPPIPGHGVIMPKRNTITSANGSTVAATAIKNPEVIEMPKPENKPEPTESEVAPITPPQPTSSTPPTAEANKPAQSMLERLKEKGINIPEKKDIAQPDTQAQAPSGDSQPPSQAWPEDNQK